MTNIHETVFNSNLGTVVEFGLSTFPRDKYITTLPQSRPRVCILAEKKYFGRGMYFQLF